MTQQEIISSLPHHLRPFVKAQDYSSYTPRDQAVWRFVMQQLTRQLAESAHPVYVEGLARTGISTDRIPTIDEMNRCLGALGWRAVAVDGFIPPAIFMEFQSLKVLVIAVDMRSIDHIFYTPAPDFLHESAGHAPFIVDIDYAEFLQSFGEVGMKAIATKDDLAIYEAIRKLSILKESTEDNTEELAEAEAELTLLTRKAGDPSEAALLTRLHWWTVEYGLVGELDDFRIFGAGLLSSLSESAHCLDDCRVKKLPLTVDAVLTAYDITREQPLLFVTRSCKHLSPVLEEFAASMCFRKGGADSLRTAIDAGSICTASYNTGMQVSGIFCEVLCDAVGNAIYLRTNGPTQLAYKEQEIPGHGIDYHGAGFGSPVGALKDLRRCLSEYTIDELKPHNIVIGERARLEYLSGITVEGTLLDIHRQEHRNLVLSFADCTVSSLSGDVLFDPSWGTYDLAVGTVITSVYGGVADRENLQLYKPTPSTETIQVRHDEQLMEAYSLVNQLPMNSLTSASTHAYGELFATLERHPQEWLLRAEVIQRATGVLRANLILDLQRIASSNSRLAPVIELILTQETQL